MNTRKILLFLCISSFLLGDAFSQTRSRRGRRQTPPVPAPKASPTPEPAPVIPRIPRQVVKLALVNGQTITTSDVDPRAAEVIETLDQRLAEARLQILLMEVNTLLLNLEARKRNITSQQLYDTEIGRRIGVPSEAEITKFIADNRNEFDGEDSPAVRAEVKSLMQADREAKLSDELVRRLRLTFPVTINADINAANLPPNAVIATVGGVQITAGKIGERLKPILYELRLNTYELATEALNRTITDLLLIAEANKRNVGPEEIVRSEVTSKLRPPTEAEVAKFYSENKARINSELEAVKNQLANYLQEQDQRRLEQAMADRLRQGANIKLLLTPPEVPTQSVTVDDDPARGSASAPVTIVEFTDFQCPSCAAMHPILEDALKTYASKVRLVVRDFPLRGHANAFKAAEAANAAHAQGKFFEYTALLFKRQNALDVPSLKKYASELGLDRARFDSELDRGIYSAEIRKDMNDGEVYGVGSTPTIFINGVMLRSLSAEALREAIDRALAAAPAKPGP
jgi:protein-disulfide isomerase